MRSNSPDGGEPYPASSNVSVSRADTDLPEFDEFLKQVGYGHLYRYLPEEEVVEPEPAFMAPATPPLERSASVRRAAMVILGAVAMFAAAIVMLWTPLQGVLDSFEWPGESTDYVASPFFALGRFESIRPGMTEDEVRDRVGPPLARRLRSGPGHEAWIYSAPKDLEQSKFLLCVITIEDGVVTVARATYAEPRGDLGYLWSAAPSREVGDLTLVRGDGRQQTLNAKRGDFAVLSSLPDEADALASGVPGGRAYRVNASGNAGRVVAPGPGRKGLENCYSAASVAFPSMCVYVKGRLLALPWHAAGIALSAHQRDLEWLVLQSKDWKE